MNQEQREKIAEWIRDPDIELTCMYCTHSTFDEFMKGSTTHLERIFTCDHIKTRKRQSNLDKAVEDIISECIPMNTVELREKLAKYIRD